MALRIKNLGTASFVGDINLVVGTGDTVRAAAEFPGNFSVLPFLSLIHIYKTEIILAMDTDKRGVELRDELVRRLGVDRCKVVALSLIHILAIPGSSFFTAFYNYHANNPNCKIFLLGAAEEIGRASCRERV